MGAPKGFGHEMASVGCEMLFAGTGWAMHSPRKQSQDRFPLEQVNTAGASYES